MKTNRRGRAAPMTSVELARYVRDSATAFLLPLEDGTKLSEYEDRVLRSIIERCNALASVIETMPAVVRDCPNRSQK